MITVNNQLIKTFKFPGGEMQVTLSAFKNNGEIRIVALLKNSDDIMSLLLTVDALRRYTQFDSLKLLLPYFPYGRQDRVCEFGQSLSASVMANLINSLNCDMVSILDPHSDVTPALIKNSNIIDIVDLKILIGDKLNFDDFTLVCPDVGAKKRISKLTNNPIIQCFKERNTETGKIDHIKIFHPLEKIGTDLLVVDDICDGGATFIELGKKFKSYKYAHSLNLYVTHGIFSKGLDELFKYYDNIYCYYTFLENPDPRLQILGDIYAY